MTSFPEYWFRCWPFTHDRKCVFPCVQYYNITIFALLLQYSMRKSKANIVIFAILQIEHLSVRMIPLDGEGKEIIKYFIFVT